MGPLKLIQITMIQSILKILKRKITNLFLYIPKNNIILNNFYYIVLICFLLACVILLWKKYMEMIGLSRQDLDQKKKELAISMLETVKNSVFKKKKLRSLYIRKIYGQIFTNSNIVQNIN